MNNKDMTTKIEKQKTINFEALRITHASKIPPIEPIVIIRESTVAVKGGLFLLGGVQKSGKSFVGSKIIAGALGWNFGNLPITVKPANGAPVVFFNTEMSQSDLKKYHDDLLKTLLVTETPPNLFVFHILDMTKAERLNYIEAFLEAHQNTHLAIIDGAADLVDSTNDETHSSIVIETLAKLADRYKICIGGVVHENMKSQTTRGHFGQIFERKAVGAFSVKKDKDLNRYSIEANVLRHSADFKPVFFERNDTNGITMIDVKTNDKGGVSAEEEKCFKKLYEVMGESSIPSRELKGILISKNTGSSTNDAKRKAAEREIEKAEKFGLIDYKDIKGVPSVFIKSSFIELYRGNGD